MDDLVNTISEKNRKNTLQSIVLNWTDNPAVQKLLDVVVVILAEEYIERTRMNTDSISTDMHRLGE